MAVVECPSCGTLLEFVMDDDIEAIDTPETIDWDDFLLNNGYYFSTLTNRSQ